MPRALLVDDDRSCLEMLAEIVREEGFVVDTAGTIGEAERRATAHPPDLLLLDLFLPDGQSLDLLGPVLRKAPCTVIVMTGHASVETAVDAMRRGARDYLVKPVDPAKLRNMLSIVFQSCITREPASPPSPSKRGIRRT